MKFLKALAVFLGTVIGVGIFGLPFVASKAGFFIVLLYFLFIVLVTILVFFLYSEIVLNTKGIHRLPGYVGEYLGEKWKKITFLIIAVGLMGALLAYLIIGGQFLSSFLSPYFGGNSTLYTLLFFILGAYLVLRGIKSISGVELFLLFFLFVILILFFIKAFPFIDIDNFKTFDLKYIAFPYGIILFSFWGSAVIPEIKEMVKGSKKELRKVIITGIIIVLIVYLSFIYIVLGSSSIVSEDAISGLEKTFGSNIIKFGFIFGVITCFTSFLILALTLKKVLWYDFGFDKNLAWFLTCFPSLILFLLGVREFIKVISFTGAVALGFEGIIIVFLYKEFLKRKFLKKMNPVLYFLVGIFILGIIFEIAYFLW